MEGIIPFIFKVIAQYKEEAQAASFGGMASDDSVEPSPVSSSYVLLPVDSEAVTTCSARPSPLRCSTLRRRA
jgi:hypothetical protein